MVSKRTTSLYRTGRSAAWPKTKRFEESVYEVAGVFEKVWPAGDRLTSDPRSRAALRCQFPQAD